MNYIERKLFCMLENLLIIIRKQTHLNSETRAPILKLHAQEFIFKIIITVKSFHIRIFLQK